MTQQLAAPTRTESRAANIGLWVLQVLLALGMGSSGIFKLAGAEPAVQLFDDIGAGQWFRYVVGALELAGAIGLLIPRLAGLAALGLAGVMAGAVVTDAFIIDGNPVVPLVYLLLLAVVAWGRRRRTAELVRRFTAPA